MPDEVKLDNVPILNGKASRPSFSIIVPTWGDFDGLARTIGNLCLQSGTDIKREILVISDGFEEKAKQVVEHYKKFVVAKDLADVVGVGYGHVRAHNGSGNYARRLGLKAAKMDWVMFIDAGTSVCLDCLDAIATSIEQNPEATIVNWDIVQLLDPIPIASSVRAVQNTKRDKGLPYVIPGVSVAVRRDVAQTVEWPVDVRGSDWAYMSQIWKARFGEPEDEKKVEKELVLIPWTLVVSYGARTERKAREPLTRQQYNDLGYEQGWHHASSELILPEEPIEVTPQPKIITPTEELN